MQRSAQTSTCSAADAAEQVADVVAGVDNRRLGVGGCPPLPPGRAHFRHPIRRSGGCVGEDREIAAQLVTCDQVGGAEDMAKGPASAGDEVFESRQGPPHIPTGS